MLRNDCNLHGYNLTERSSPHFTIPVSDLFQSTAFFFATPPREPDIIRSKKEDPKKEQFPKQQDFHPWGCPIHVEFLRLNPGVFGFGAYRTYEKTKQRILMNLAEDILMKTMPI